METFFEGAELLAVAFRDEEEDDKLDRAVFDSYSAASSWLSFSLNSFLRSLPSLVSTGLIFESTAMARAKESGGFLLRAVLASSLKGSSLVAHTSKLGLHELRDDIWLVFGLVASSIECQRCGLVIEVPCAIALKLFAGIIR